jgi:hypothetical protein
VADLAGVGQAVLPHQNERRRPRREVYRRSLRFVNILDEPVYFSSGLTLRSMEKNTGIYGDYKKNSFKQFYYIIPRFCTSTGTYPGIDNAKAILIFTRTKKSDLFGSGLPVLILFT